MGTLASSNDIDKLLRMKGSKRLQVRDEVTEKILELPPGVIDLQFLESKRFSGWNEYNALFRIKKIKESAPYFEVIFGSLSRLMKDLSDIENDGLGIQEVECGLPDYYYVLIYIIKNDGKESNEKQN